MNKVKQFFIDFGLIVYKGIKKVGLLLWDLVLRIALSARDLGVAIWHGCKTIVKGLIKFHKRFIDSSIWTKLSHFIMGAGNIARKQYVKGFIFLAIQIAFLSFMLASPQVNNTSLGLESIGNFFTLGEEDGMPVSQDVGVTKHLVEVYAQTNEDGDYLIKSGFELEEETYYAQLSQIIRFTNLYNAITDNSVTAKDNDGSVSKYAEAEKIVIDNRYNTNDKYAYSTSNAGESISLKGSATTLLMLVTKNKLNTENDINQNDFVDLYTALDSEGEEKEISDLGVFYNETKYEDGQTEYVYYLLVQTQSGKSLTYFSLNDTPLLEGATIHVFSYDKTLVTSSVDNSFLMMLFGIITFIIIALYLVAFNLNIASSYKADTDLREGLKPTSFIEDLKSLLDGRFHLSLLTPAIILIVIFTIIPTILMIFIAFTDMQSSSATSGIVLVNWRGFENFVSLFGGDASNEIAREVGRNFGRVLLWTFEWALIATFSCYFGGIFLALLINRKDVKLKKLWRTIFILTIAIPQFITLLIMRNLLIETGPINSMLLDLKIISEPIDFLKQSSAAGTSAIDIWTARGTVLVINLYIGIPYTMLMTSGILMNIPSDLYEAATIDGANKWQMFRKITLPYVIFVTTPYLISSFIGNITSFNTIFLTTGGGPTLKGSGDIAGHTDLLVTWLYKLTVDNYKYNAGSIIGILTFLITASITLICYRNSKAYKEEDTFQ